MEDFDWNGQYVFSRLQRGWDIPSGYVPCQYGNCSCFDVQHIASFSGFPLGNVGNEASMRARAYRLVKTGGGAA